MAQYNVNDTVTITGKVSEVVSNEDFGTRYTVKVKSNDKMIYLNFEEDEIGGGTTTTPSNP